ncbi:MAG: methylmalonyl-CoA mutase family protein [Fidelibacterota bacterium]
MNNVVRVTIQALAGVLGGVQSLHTNSLDETLALPSEQAVLVALRTQQIIAYESGIPDVVDPLAGSYFIETLCDELEKAAMKLIHKIDDLGGAVSAIEQHFQQEEISRSAFAYQKAIDNGEKVVVGVNQFTNAEEASLPLQTIDPEAVRTQISRLNTIRSKRDNTAVNNSLEALQNAAEDGTMNLIPYIIDAVKQYATLGEIIGTLKKTFGEYIG